MSTHAHFGRHARKMRKDCAFCERLFRFLVLFPQEKIEFFHFRGMMEQVRMFFGRSRTVSAAFDIA